MIACTVFTQGCNMRCPYCQNGGLVLPSYFDEPIPEDEVLAKIKKRAGILEGVCVTGGEPTVQPDLAEFLKKIKDLGLKVKLDSNGRDPDLLDRLWKDHLIDMVAMDIKASPSRYAYVAGLHGLSDPAVVIAPYDASIRFLLSSGIDYEFRTTLVRGLHDYEQMEDICDWIAGAKAYYLQSYRESDLVISLLENRKDLCSSFSNEELNTFLSIARKKIPTAMLRGI